jgi:hypothetical protein
MSTKSKKKQCGKCTRQTDARNNYCAKCETLIALKDTPTSSHYNLSKDDWVVNAMAFIHACGVLEEFIDKMHSFNPELMMNTWSDGSCVAEKLLDSTLLDEYDETSYKGTYIGFFDQKSLHFSRRKKYVN